MPRIHRCHRLLAAMLAAWAMLSPIAHGDEPADPQAPSTVPFRRVLVPADRPEQWPLDGEPYLPVEREEFERLVQSASGGHVPDVPGAGQPVIAAARYWASFDGQDFSGRGEWQFVRVSDAQELVHLTTNLAIDQARWREVDGSVMPRPVLGMTNHGTQVLLAPRSANLVFEWSLRSGAASTAETKFEFQLPRSAASSLELRLPEYLIPTAPGAIVSKQEIDGARVVWLLELGSQPNVSLTLRRGGDTAAPSEMPSVREQLTYDISQRGLELTAELELLDIDKAQGEIEIAVDPALAVLMVEVDGAATPWSRAEEDEPSVLRIRPARPLHHKSVVHLSALAPIVMDQKWRLPAVHAVGVAPQEGKIVCRVLSPLVLNDVQAESSRQVSAGLLALPLSGELLEFETFASDRALDVWLSLQAPVESFASATTLTLAQNDLLANSNYRARLRDGQLFRLTGEVASGWAIESVESANGTEITNWVVDRADTPAKLRIAVESSLRGGQWLELRVVARKLDWVMGKSATLAELIPLQFVADGPRADWIAFDLPGDVHLRFADGPAPAPIEADAAMQQLFPRGVSTANLFAVDGRTGKRSLHLERDQPGFTAQVEHVARVDDNRLAETYVIVCTPAGGMIDRLRLEFAEAGESTLEWPTQTGEGSSLNATRVDEGEREIWDVQLAKPQFDPFSIRLVRTRPLEAEAALALATVNSARTQQGIVLIEAPETLSLDLRPRGMRPVSRRDHIRNPAVRAEYEYQTGAPRAGEAASLTIAPGGGVGPAPLIVWNASLVAQCDADGRVVQQARYCIESHGAELLTLSLGRQQQVIATTVDGQHVDAVLRAQRVEVPLPARERFCVVTLTLRSRDRAWGPVHGFTPDLPEPLGAVHVVRRDVRLAIPGSYVIPSLADAQSAARGPTIAQRLFGVLGNTSGGNSIASPWGNVGASPGELDRSEQAVLLALGRAAFGRERASNWGEALRRCAADVERQNGRSLRIDRAALASLDLGSDTELPANVGGASLVEQARTLLDQAGLTLVAQRELLVVTRRGFEQRFADGDLAANAGDEGLVTAAYWPRASGHPWTRVAGDTPLESNDSWNVYHLTLPAGESRTLRMVNADAIALTGWMVMIATAGICAWALKGRWTGLSIALALAVVVALLTPAVFVPIASSLVLGLLLAMLVEFVRTAPRAPSPASAGMADADSRRSSYSRAVATTGLMVALLVTGSHGSEPGRGQPAFRVFMPVDSAGEPVGKHVYVPAAFWRELRARAQSSAVDWILSGARYQGEVKWDSGRQRLVLPSLTADYRLHVLSAGATVRLPLSAESTLSNWSLHLDGQQVAARFDSAEHAVTFTVAEAGEHHLQLRFAPLVQYSPQRAYLETPIAAMPTAKADLVLPPELPPIEFVARRGAMHIDEQGRRVVAQLGDVDRLAIEWTTSAGPALDDFLPDADQLLWLRVRPGSVTIESKFSFIRPAGMSTFEIVADRNLRYIAPDSQSAQGPEIEALDESQQVLTFALPPDEAGPMQIRARFLAPDRLGLGSFTLPRIEARTGHTRRRWLAVSIDPSLTLDEPRAGAMQSNDEFLAAWGRTDTRPDRTYQLGDGGERWTAVLRPVEARIEGSSLLNVTVGQERMDVQYQAALEVSSARLFQYRLQVPADLNVEQVSVVGADAEQVTRWRKDASGALVVFLRSLPDGEQTLRLRGWLDAPREGAIALPDVQLAEARIQSTAVQLARRSDTLVELAASNLTAIALPSSPSVQEADAFVVGQYQCEGVAPQGELRLTANRPDVRSTVVTRLVREATGWKAVVDCDLQVGQGAVDALHFSVPSWWTGPFSATPAATIRVERDTAELQELVVHFAQPVELSQQIRWEAPLPGGNSELRLPTVNLKTGGELEQYVALPAREASRWQLSGVRRAEPPRFSQLGVEPERMTYYRCNDANYSVVAAAATQQQSVAVLYQASEVFLDARAHGYGVTTIDIAPRGRLDLVLRLPAGCTLLQALLDDAPAVVAPLDQQRQRLLLHSDSQPQRLRLLYDGVVRGVAGSLAVPTVEADQQPEIAWLVRSTMPLSWRTAEGISQAEFDRLAWAQCRAMYESTSRGADTPQAQMAAQLWWARSQQAQQAVGRAREASSPEQGLAVDARRPAVEQSIDPVTDGASARLPAGQGTSAESLAPLAALELSGQRIFAGGFLSADATAPPLVYTTPRSDVWLRLALAAMIAGGTLAWWRYRPELPARAIFYRWPWLLLATVGLTWWLLLAPAIFGLLLLALALGAMVSAWLQPRLGSARGWPIVRRETDSRFA